MRKLNIFIMGVILSITLIACTPTNEVDNCSANPDLKECQGLVDCTVTPDHEECKELEIDCTVTPNHEDCQVDFDLSQWDDVDGRTITFFDDFDGNQLDTSVWEYMIGTGSQYGIGYWGNNEAQFYTDNNTVVENGELQIIVKKEQTPADNNSGTIMNYTSARLRTKESFSQTYGRFEARVRLDIADEGLWPAFWLLPTDNIYGGWPHSGEFDIMEIRGRLPDHTTAALHYSYINHTYDAGSYYYQDDTDITDYHVYALEWTPTTITFYCDDEIVLDLDDWRSAVGEFPAPFDQDFHILLNLAVGGNFDGGRLPDDSNLPATMYVDYVKVLAYENDEFGRKIPEGSGDVYLLDNDLSLSVDSSPFTLEYFVFDGLKSDVAWFTSDPNIAVVNQAGTVTIKDQGTVDIIVKTGSSEAVCTIVVTD